MIDKIAYVNVKIEGLGDYVDFKSPFMIVFKDHPNCGDDLSYFHVQNEEEVNRHLCIRKTFDRLFKAFSHIQFL